MTQRMWKNHDLKKNYDVVIIGGGAHGLATAYYLAQLGITNVAVLEQKYIGYGVPDVTPQFSVQITEQKKVLNFMIKASRFMTI